LEIFVFQSSCTEKGGIIWQEFLRNQAFPLLKGCADFFLDWLVEDGNGNLVTNPSTSPEHHFIAPDGREASVSYGSTMDMAILHDLFSAIISAAMVSIYINAGNVWSQVA
jgi:alpha-L-fucosidase 2